MDRYAIFVDAGYFFAAGAQAALGRSIPRKQVSIKSPQQLFCALCAKASIITDNLPLLRAYWYDAMPGPRLSLEQNSLAMLSGIKLRLGALNSAGEQKGVDSLIVTDLIDLARNRAIADAVLVTGDEDLRIAVQVAQSFGVRVHILAAGEPSQNVSPALQMEADSVSALDGHWFSTHLDHIVPPKASTSPTASGKESVFATPAPTASAGMSHDPATDLASIADKIIQEILSGCSDEQLKKLVDHFSSQNTVPPEYDGKMIARVSSELSNRCLTGDERRLIRGRFITATRNFRHS